MTVPPLFGQDGPFPHFSYPGLRNNSHYCLSEEDLHLSHQDSKQLPIIIVITTNIIVVFIVIIINIITIIIIIIIIIIESMMQKQRYYY